MLVIVATTICKLYENAQILTANQTDEAPYVDRPRPRRKSNESAVSGFDDDDNSIQSMHSKAWSTVVTSESGSIPKSSTNRSKPTIQFVFDPESPSEFPPLPSNAATANSPRNDNSSVGSISTVTKSEFEAFQSRISRDLATNLKACQSLASSVTGDSTQSSAMDDMRAERKAMQAENQAARQQQNEQMTMFMQQFQQMMNYFLTSRENQQHQQQPCQQSQ